MSLAGRRQQQDLSPVADGAGPSPQGGPISTRDHILDVARTLIATHGYDGMTISDLSYISGFPPSSIYYHFGSKLGVLAALLERTFDDLHASYPGPSSFDDLPALERFERWFTAACASLDERPEYLRLLLAVCIGSHAEVPAVRDVVRRIRDYAHESWIDVLRPMFGVLDSPEEAASLHQLAILGRAITDGLSVSTTFDGSTYSSHVAPFVALIRSFVDQRVVATEPSPATDGASGTGRTGACGPYDEWVSNQAGDRSSRDVILDIAQQLVSTRGYDGMSISQLSSLSGLPPSSIYYHFGNKLGVLTALLERAFADFHDSAPSPSSFDDHPPVERFELWFTATCEGLDRRPEYLRLVLAVVLGSHSASDAVKTAVRQLRDYAHASWIDALTPIFGPPSSAADEELLQRMAVLGRAVTDGLSVSTTVDGMSYSSHVAPFVSLVRALAQQRLGEDQASS